MKKKIRDDNACTSSQASSQPASQSQSLQYAQIKDDPNFSPAHKLYLHIRDVNNSRADLDVTLLPKGASLVYSPQSRQVDVETPEDYEELEFPEPANQTAITPSQFYKKDD